MELFYGACFLPVLYFITVCEICRVHLNRFLTAAICLLQCALFGFVCTIGSSGLFYQDIVFHSNLVVYLTKVLMCRPQLEVFYRNVI